MSGVQALQAHMIRCVVRPQEPKGAKKACRAAHLKLAASASINPSSVSALGPKCNGREDLRTK